MTEDQLRKVMAQYVRAKIEQFNLSPVEFSRLTGIPNGDLSKALRGLDRAVTLGWLVKIANKTGTPLSAMFAAIGRLVYEEETKIPTRGK